MEKPSELTVLDFSTEDVTYEYEVTEMELSGDEEKDLSKIFKATFGESRRDETLLKEAKKQAPTKKEDIVSFPKPTWVGEDLNEPYLLIDGYNAIYAFPEFKPFLERNMDSAREIFLDLMMNYQGFRKKNLIVVFDGYQRKGSVGSIEYRGAVKVVFTKETETADKYIQKLIYEEGKKKNYTVITSDRMVQMASFGDGAKRLSSHEFYSEVMTASSEIREKLSRQIEGLNRPFEGKL